MAFDVNNPADLAALKSEQANDPISMGYAAVDGQTKKTLDLFNVGELNVGGETTGELFTARLILEVTDPDDLTPGGQFSQGDLEWVKLLMESTYDIDQDLASFEVKFRSVFAANSNTITELDSRLRRLSRAEVLFGINTVISRADWFTARDS